MRGRREKWRNKECGKGEGKYRGREVGEGKNEDRGKGEMREEEKGMEK